MIKILSSIVRNDQICKLKNDNIIIIIININIIKYYFN